LTDLSQERLKELLEYDHETGWFYWRVDRGKAKTGNVAGTEDTKGYIKICIDGCRYGAHQLVWLYVHGKIIMLNHKNNKPWDNRLDNLEPTTYSHNNHKKYTYNSTGFRGVRFRGNMYEAHIRVKGVITRIGKYETAKEASGAYEQAAKEHFG